MFGVRMARASARERATLDLIEKVESTPHYRALHSAFSYHRRQDCFARLHNPTEAKDKEERQSVLAYLNHYELVSIGLTKKILDEDIYKRWMLGPFVRDWNAAADFIQKERWKRSASEDSWYYHSPLFEHYQKYACKWSNDAVRIDEHYSGPPDAASGPGDEPVPKAAAGNDEQARTAGT